MKAWYTTDYHGPYAIELGPGDDLADPSDQEAIAEKCAKDFHSNRDGFECSWPREFTLYAERDGSAIATFDVDLDVEPVFGARRREVSR